MLAPVLVPDPGTLREYGSSFVLDPVPVRDPSRGRDGVDDFGGARFRFRVRSPHLDTAALPAQVRPSELAGLAHDPEIPLSAPRFETAPGRSSWQKAGKRSANWR